MIWPEGWRKKEPTVRLADRIADLQWRREHDEPVPYTPVVLVDEPQERERVELITCTRDEWDAVFARYGWTWIGNAALASLRLNQRAERAK